MLATATGRASRHSNAILFRRRSAFSDIGESIQSCLVLCFWRSSMPADDHPFDALEQQYEMEDLSVSPVTRAVLGLVSLVPLKWPFDKAMEMLKGHLAADSLERIRLMLETCMTEVRKHEGEIRQLRDTKTAEETQAREESQESCCWMPPARRKAHGPKSVSSASDSFLPTPSWNHRRQMPMRLKK